jgi:glycosyltransferase involved in cell wall biosynthesis
LRLLFFGTYDARSHPRVEVLRDGCRANGDDVAECNVPLDVDTAARVRLARQPWRAPSFLLRLGAAWLRLLLRSRGAGRVDAVVVGYLGQLDVRVARLRWPRTPLVLDYLVAMGDTAADRSAGGARVQRLLGRVDRAATRAADVVVVDTDEQRATVLAPPRDRVVVVPVGAPQWWFHEPEPLPDGPLRVLFFGLYTPLQGAPVIARAIAALRDDSGVTFTMIGSGQEVATARTLAAASPHATWVDWTDPAALPAVARAHHVCLGVFGTGQKALRVVPNKAYQGAAAGCAIVTSDTPPQRRVLGDAATYVPPGDDAALAATLRALGADRARVDALRRAAYDLADTAFRAEHVVAPLREALATAAAGRSGRR